MASKVVLMMVFCLGTLWMLHLLARDYQRIRKQPVATAARFLGYFGRKKRDVSEFGATTAALEAANQENNNGTHSVNWDFIMKFDPLECAQSMICQLATDEDQYDEESEAMSIKKFIEDSVQDDAAPKRISRAYKLGRTSKKVTTCQEKFYMCPYSGKTMLTIIDLQSRIMG